MFRKEKKILACDSKMVLFPGEIIFQYNHTTSKLMHLKTAIQGIAVIYSNWKRRIMKKFQILYSS